MRLNTALLLITAWSVMVSSSVISCAQVKGEAAKKPTQGKLQSPVTGSVQFQLVRTDGTEIYLVKDVRDPDKQQQAVTYTVSVPFTVLVDMDGKKVAVTKMRTETRTRLTHPTIRKSIPATRQYTFKTIDRKSISKQALIGMLGMGEGKMVVQVFPKQTIPSVIKNQLRKDTIIMEYEPRRR